MMLYIPSEIPEISNREIMRYAGAPNKGLYDALLDECIKEAKDAISYRLCYTELPLKKDGDNLYIGDMTLKSRDLSTCLADCGRVLLFVATLGVGLDRLINKYSKILPSKALFFQAIGSERIEALCDAFCKEYKSPLTPRFSAGYGDLSLDSQREIFKVLDARRLIGVTLNDSLIMSPSKSVTAFAGIKE